MIRYYAQTNPEPYSWEAEHRKLTREIAARGMVLLENRGALPLRENSEVALYGYGARHTAFCGYGAASTSSRTYVNIEDGLTRAGIRVTTKAYLDRMEPAILEEENEYYRKIREEVPKYPLILRIIRMYGDPFMPHCAIPILDSDDASRERKPAIYVLTRVAGEGADRKPAAGDYELSEGEKENLQYLNDHYKNVILILNTCGVVDLSFVRSLPHLGAILFTGLNGGTTGDSVADLLTGKVTPEGKLPSTWAERYSDYPNAADFGPLSQDAEEAYYTEGVFVGYRYFDSMGIRPAYAFGSGESYTTFSWEFVSCGVQKKELVVNARVKNTGSVYSGREVLQAYVSCPKGSLPQPAQKLAGFQKTPLLAPGEETTQELRIDLEQVASFREADHSRVLEQGDYIVRLGNSSRNTNPILVLHLPEEVVFEYLTPVFPKETVGIEEEFCPAEERSIFFGETLPADLPVVNYTYGQPPKKYAFSERSENTAGTDAAALQKNEAAGDALAAPLTFEDLLSDRCTAEELAADLTPEELAFLLVGNVPGLTPENLWKEDADPAAAGQTIVAETRDTGAGAADGMPVDLIPGASDTTRMLMDTRRIPNMNVCDGGTGLRTVPEFMTYENGELIPKGLSSVKGVDKLFADLHADEKPETQETEQPKAKPGMAADEQPKEQPEEKKIIRRYQYTTPLPMATILAGTWDPQDFLACGRIEGREMNQYGVKLWLGPSMNIHRNPLCGRNFEYYSEDPLLTGIAASGLIAGIQEFPGAGACMKHVACNNQEFNRGGVNVHVSERALREIYLRGFEIAQKKAHPMSMMTALNLVNGTHAANSREILTTIARDEWGFSGFVMTDWGTTSGEQGTAKYAPSSCAGCIEAGNDLIMPGTKEDVRALLLGQLDGTIAEQQIRWCAANLLRVMKRLYEDKNAE